jgi:hypothetical protein
LVDDELLMTGVGFITTVVVAAAEGQFNAGLV